ncbi:hypothetical protein AAW51_2006 [Caldimonas brevitalea]|uniref:Ribosome association toxin RatA n=2 Tax=Caldimonas brevitalea TaxID=413882 RepID=A0A0G3BH62_9BURK|nr:hypothetical protein AAW51_2006 [Caldimonas brevitalea]
MAHLAEVSLDDQGHWQWKAHVPVAGELEWSSQVIEDLPGHRIVWQSLEGAELPNRGELVFHSAPADWGTEVTLTWRFDPPGGKLGDLVAKWLHAPEVAVSLALRRFKSLAETGEVPSLAHNPAARRDPDPYGAFE